MTNPVEFKLNTGFGEDSLQQDMNNNSQSSNLTGSIYENQLVFGVRIARELIEDINNNQDDYMSMHHIGRIEQMAL